MNDCSPRRLRFAALALLMLLFSACGFRPLYGGAEDPAAAGPQLQGIVVSPIADRVGQQLRNALLDRLTPAGKPAEPLYRLDVTLTEFTEFLAITRADEATRTRLIITATYVLHDWTSNAVVHSSQARAVSAYNVLRADFGNVIAERDARTRLAQQLAEHIRTELAAWFDRGLALPAAPLAAPAGAPP